MLLVCVPPTFVILNNEIFALILKLLLADAACSLVLIAPATSNLVFGLLVPIPTLPLWANEKVIAETIASVESIIFFIL